MVMEVGDANFESETSEGVVVVDFFAEWCGPCRMLAPVLEKLTGAKVVKVDCDKNHELARKFNVFSIPKVVIMKDGEQVSEFTGIQAESTLQTAINEASNPQE